jgi:Thrombospondin type 3 repeat
MSKLISRFLLSLAASTALAMPLHSAASEAPNVLIILDNTANWTAPFPAQISALQDTFDNRLDGVDINVGLMLFTETGDGNNNVDGGYIRAAIRNMTNVSAEQVAYNTLYSNLFGGLDITGDKSNSGKIGLAMAEAYFYFAGLEAFAGNNKDKTDWGKDGIYNQLIGIGDCCTDSLPVWALPGNALDAKSSTTYNSPLPQSGAGNFIIYIGGPVQDSNADSVKAEQLLAAQGGDVTRIPLSPSGAADIVSDEWARFMRSSDLGITTFAIDVNPTSTGMGPSWSALLESMASVSDGLYQAVDTFNTPSASPMDVALDEVFTRILTDTDSDGVSNITDNCPTVPNGDQLNTDGAEDGGDACDSDDDNDSWQDVYDNCPLVSNIDQADGNEDSVGDACDWESDGVRNNVDNCPLIVNPDQVDSDGNGRGDACEGLPPGC